MSIQGRIKLGILQDGKHRFVSDWQKNLILTKGMNNFATVMLVDLFKYAAKGTGSTATRVTSANVYSLSANTLTIESEFSPLFSPADIGSIFVFTNDQQVMVQAYTSGVLVTVVPVGQGVLANFTNS